MNLSITYVEHGSYIRTDFSGNLTPETAKQMSLASREIAEKVGAKKFLVNLQNATDLFSTIDCYTYMSKMQERGCEHHERFAMVFAEGHAESKFIEDIAVNRGFGLKVFYSVDEAVEWLLTDSDE